MATSFVVEEAEPMKEWVCERLRTLREAKKMSQNDVAMAVGLSGRTGVSKFEHCAYDYKASTVYRYAAVLGITMDKLFAGCPSWGKKKGSKTFVITEEILESVLRSNAIPGVAQKIKDAISVYGVIG